MRRALAPLAVLLLAASAHPQQFNRYPGIREITADRLKAHLEFVADDLMEGRNTPSHGLNTVALYISTQLKLWGVKPAGDNGTYFQTFQLPNGAGTSQNVVGIVEGSDPVLKAEYVAMGAHYDHLGMNPNLTGDQIYNGADDDGSGTVSILELAHAFSVGPKPKRSLLFVWHCGEEKGLWGSDYFTKNMTVPRANVVAQLNIDMIGRSKAPGDTNPLNNMLTGPEEIYVVGSRKLSTELGNLNDATNGALYKLSFNFHYDDPADRERIYYRSDHFNYARFGIPIIFFFDGVHEDYHRVSDEVKKIDFVKMEKVCRTVYATARTVASLAKRPLVDGKN